MEEPLAGVARAAVGAGRLLKQATRLRGGSKKGVYRWVFDDGFSAIAYVWHPDEDFWPTDLGAAGHDDPLSHASGLDLFEAARTRLGALGVRTPGVYLVDPSHTHYPADIAIIEDISGPKLEERLNEGWGDSGEVMARLAAQLKMMHGHTSDQFGKVALVDRGAVSKGISCEQIVLDRALADVSEAASRDERVSADHGRLVDMLNVLAAAIQPRSEYALIHGELGPDHVLVDRAGDPVLIDIEGLMYFDVEWEHVFLRLRFGDVYRALGRSDLDEERLAFYTLAMHLSLVAGPLRLLDGEFPDRAFMLGIIEYNVRRALAFSPQRPR